MLESLPIFLDIPGFECFVTTLRSGSSQLGRDSLRHPFDVQADKSEKDLDSYTETTPIAGSCHAVPGFGFAEYPFDCSSDTHSSLDTTRPVSKDFRFYVDCFWAFGFYSDRSHDTDRDLHFPAISSRK